LSTAILDLFLSWAKRLKLRLRVKLAAALAVNSQDFSYITFFNAAAGNRSA
jgi:hypothetical protein